MIFGGDLNTVMDPPLDRSNPRSLSRSKMAQALSTFFDQVGAVDLWRFLFPRSKAYSYFSQVRHSYSRIDYFFIDKSLLPSVEQIDYLPIKTYFEGNIQMEEILNAISLMQNKKNPGPDGYPMDFYKKFATKLAPILLDMFEDSFVRGRLPQTLNEANIILLLKPGKDNVKCNFYRPILLLNADTKILS
ncbi:hypothetical protein HF521_012682 [Silurus meridionalis]|uniref:Uncharacterized protein n=1 Tax=Silurus meridionalis TaxID=175797 RepID=A0A8T0ADH6_SILME|nr:hypothetical protein HF521_012682 [Silurus meridionalis]